MPLSPREAALILLNAGFSVVPIRTDGSKATVDKWKEYQSIRMSSVEAERVFHDVGIGIIGGAISGNLEIIDIEADAPPELFALIETHLPGLLATLPQVSTPTGGRHIYLRCASIQGNQKLAATRVGKTLIETRGEGGYVLAPTSPAACHPSGKTYELLSGHITATPTISPEQRSILLDCCRSFNEHVKELRGQQSTTAGNRPGDDYNLRGDPWSVLRHAGWSIVWQQGEALYLRRPGKDFGVSATLHKVAHNVLYVFSTNAMPFDSERAYDAFGVYCRLKHAGDIQAATKALGAEGYGEQRKPTPETMPMPKTTEQNVELIYATMSVTEHNVALVFEELNKDKLRYCDLWGKWLEWDDFKWKPDSTLLAFHYSRMIAAKLNTAGGKTPAKASFARGVEFLARTSRHFATIPDLWDRNNWLLNTPERTIDLESGESWEHRQADHITKCTRVSPADGPKREFDIFMQEITLGDEALARYLQISLGACLSGAIKEHWLLFWIGKGRNGKNTLGDLIMWIMGDYASAIPTSTLMSQKHQTHPTDVASLRGLRLACASEVSEGSYWDEAKLQELTGDSVLKARFMRQDTFNFLRTHKFLIYGRHRPLLKVVDPGMQGRMHMVPFKASFLGREDLDMPAKLRAEAPQILQWLIDGHQSWLEDGKLHKCSAVQKETDDYFSSQSTPELWIHERCITDTLAACQAGILYGNFSDWKKSRGEGVPNQTRWGEWMIQRFTKKKTGGVYVYSGIDIRPTSVLEAAND